MAAGKNSSDAFDKLVQHGNWASFLPLDNSEGSTFHNLVHKKTISGLLILSSHVSPLLTFLVWCKNVLPSSGPAIAGLRIQVPIVAPAFQLVAPTRDFHWNSKIWKATRQSCWSPGGGRPFADCISDDDWGFRLRADTVVMMSALTVNHKLGCEA